MDEKEFDYINMIPLIDVMLVLLTIVLLTSTFIMSGAVPVELPRVTAKYEDVTKTRSVEIDENGALYLDGTRHEFAALKEKLRQIPRTVPFLIRADRRIPLQRFVEVLDALKGLGFSKVSVQTEWVRG
jgi:biopolymer transport protein ExbD